MASEQVKQQDSISTWLTDWANEPQSHCKYFSYRDKNDFRRLWADPKSLTGDGEAGTRTFLLIDWNGFPCEYGEAPRIIDFITPLDWALALFYDHLESDQKKLRLPQVVIVDRCSHMHPGSFAVEMRRALIEAFSGHVRVYSALGEDGDDALALIEFLKNDFGEDSSLFRSTRAPRQGQFRALRQAWIGYTVQSRDHHDINNFIGPLVLAQESGNTGVSESKTEGLENALLQMTNWLALIEQGDYFSEGWALETCIPSGIDLKAVRAILIDDQADKWSGFFRNAFSNSSPPCYEISDPHDVLKKLPEIVKISPFGRYLPTADEYQDCDQIIFLDLRFFPHGDSRERKFFEGVCDSILDLSIKLGWHCDSHFSAETMSARDEHLLSQSEWSAAEPLESPDTNKPLFIQAAKRILACRQIKWESVLNTRLYDCLLTLFPRLLSQVMFSSPVVLFSSTGRRDITEYFRSYGNISTAFEKPRLPVRPHQICGSFQEALTQSVELLNARRLMSSFSADSERQIHSVVNNSKHYHVELYIDEHHPGRKNAKLDDIWVGGFYAVFEGNTLIEAKNKSTDFDDELFNRGFAYYSRKPYGRDIKTKDKNRTAYSELKRALESKTCAPIWRGRARLKCRSGIKECVQLSSGDDTYRRSLSALIETFLCELMPVFFSPLDKSHVSFSVFAGTRVTTIKAGDEQGISRFCVAAYKWGFEVNDIRGGGQRLESLTRSTLAPIIADLMEFRRVAYVIDRAIAIRMIYDFDPNDSSPSYEPRGKLICRNCETVHSVPIDEAMVCSHPPDKRGDWARVNEVSTGKNGTQFAKLKLYDKEKRDVHRENSRKGPLVLCHSSKWANYRLQPNEDVLVSLSRNSNNAYQTNKVLDVAEGSEKQRGIEWEKLAACPNCGKPDRLRPDYPSGLYIADEVVSRPINYTDKYGSIIKQGPLDFDGVLDDALHSMIEAGRLVDLGDRVQAALKMVAAKKTADETNTTGSDIELKGRIQRRLSDTFIKITGEEFKAFANALTAADKPRQNKIKVVLSSFKQNWDNEKIKKSVKGILSAGGKDVDDNDITFGKSKKTKNITCRINCSESVAKWFFESRKNGGFRDAPWNEQDFY